MSKERISILIYYSGRSGGEAGEAGEQVGIGKVRDINELMLSRKNEN